MNKKVIIGLTVLSVAVLVTAIVVPIVISNNNKATTPTPPPTPVETTTKTNTNWRRFVAAEQLHTLTEQQAQFRINQARMFWPTWLDVVEPDGTIKPGATIDPTTGGITPGSINSVTSVTVSDPTSGSLIDSINTTNPDLEFAFTDIVYAPDIATTLPAEVQDDLGEGKPTGWVDAEAAKTEMQAILDGVTNEALEDIESTEDLEDYLEDKDLDDDDAEDAYEAELIALVDLPAEQVDEVEFYVQKVVNGESTTYTLNPIVTLEDDFFASAQPTPLEGLTFATELTQVYEIDWVDNADDTIQKWIDESPTELKTSEAIFDFLNTKTTEILDLLTGSTDVLDETTPFTLKVEGDDEEDEEDKISSLTSNIDDDDEDNRPEFELILTFNLKENSEETVQLEDDKIDLEIKSSFRQQVAVNWTPSAVQAAISANPAITDLVTLNNWLSNASNQATIKGWFTNSVNVESVSIVASGTGPFTLTPTLIKMNPGFVNTEQVEPITTLTIANSVNWIPATVQTAISANSAITDLATLNTWLGHADNAATIKAWFTPSTNVQSVSIVASGTGPFTLTPTVTMNSGFSNSAVPTLFTNLTISAPINWNPATVQAAISANTSITNLETLNNWLENPTNAATINAWFTNHENATISVAATGEGPFTLTPTVTPKAGFVNTATPTTITTLTIANDVNWNPTVVKTTLEGNVNIQTRTQLVEWLENATNDTTIKGWFGNNVNVQSITFDVSETGPFTIEPIVNMNDGFTNKATITPITNLTISAPINWNPATVQAAISANTSITNLETLNNWLENPTNAATINAWFTNHENATISVAATGEGPFTLTPTVTPKAGFVNTATPTTITTLTIANDVNWNPTVVKTTLEENANIQTRTQLVEWLGDATNDTTIKGWFGNNVNVQSITFVVSETGPFTITPTVNMNNGFTNTARPVEISGLMIDASINWDPATVQAAISGNSEITDLTSLNNWLENEANAATINAWFTNHENATISVAATGDGPFTLTPTVTPKAGFVNTATPTAITTLTIANDVNWVEADVQEEIDTLLIDDPAALSAWLADTTNAATIKAWFTNNENATISVTAETASENSSTLTAEVTMNGGFTNSATLPVITITFGGPVLN